MRRSLIVLCLLPATLPLHAQTLAKVDLPDAPGFLLFQPQNSSQSSTSTTPVDSSAGASAQAQPPAATRPTARLPYCPPDYKEPVAAIRPSQPATCIETHNIYKRFSNFPGTTPMTASMKGFLAIHDIIDPFNILTILGNSAFAIGINSHTAYGPGMRGFGYNAGLSFVQDATGEVIGTFAIASLAHQDPRYHRMPQARPMRRILHAVSHTIISHHDDGRPMPNIETLSIYPISAELSNLYVPGIADDGKSTAARISLGLLSDPIGNVITEFLPDFASHVHIQVVFVQRILNQVATGQSGGITINSP